MGEKKEQQAIEEQQHDTMTLLGEMFCLDVTLTFTTYLSIVVDHVRHFMETGVDCCIK